MEIDDIKKSERIDIHDRRHESSVRLKPIDSWLFTKVEGIDKITLEFLIDLKEGQLATVDIQEFAKHGSKAITNTGFPSGLNRRFIAMKLPLIARPYRGWFVQIHHKREFDNYSLLEERVPLSKDRRMFLLNELEKLNIKKVMEE